MTIPSSIGTDDPVRAKNAISRGYEKHKDEALVLFVI